jgi:hypothetical protein
MARYATCECFICHQVVPKPTAHSITVEREKGRSSGSHRISRHSTSYYTGRTYYTQKELWICADCYPAYERQRQIRSAIGAIGALAVLGLFGFLISGGLSQQPATTTIDTASDEVPVQTASLVHIEEVKSQPVTAPTSSSVPALAPTDVTKIQTRLIELGYLQGPADGLWGSRSRQALLAFKISNGLASDDKLDPSVNERMFFPDVVRGPLSVVKPARREK